MHVTRRRRRRGTGPTALSRLGQPEGEHGLGGSRLLWGGRSGGTRVPDRGRPMTSRVPPFVPAAALRFRDAIFQNRPPLRGFSVRPADSRVRFTAVGRGRGWGAAGNRDRQTRRLKHERTVSREAPPEVHRPIFKSGDDEEEEKITQIPRTRAPAARALSDRLLRSICVPCPPGECRRVGTTLGPAAYRGHGVIPYRCLRRRRGRTRESEREREGE